MMGARNGRMLALACTTVSVSLLLAGFGRHSQAQKETWQQALPGYRYEFPRDHFNHPGYQTEWWYYTGNLKAADGHRFGFELTFFRQGTARTDRGADATASGEASPKSPWDVNDIYFAHLALSDLDGGRFYHTQRVNRAGPGLAGADQQARRIWNGNWEVRFQEAAGAGEPAQSLQAVCDDFTLRLTLHSEKPPVIHGLDGVSQKAPGRGQASHYISYTRLEAAGEVTLGGRGQKVTGLAWMDHEFFTHQLTAEQTGWDWFSIQLAGGDELMLYRLRRRDGSMDPYSAGTYVDVRGVSRHLAGGEFVLEPGRTWTSPATGARYPVAWTVRVPSLGLTLEAVTPLENQELAPPTGAGASSWGLPVYWEGAIDLHGTERGSPVAGTGYLEMTGYEHSVQIGLF